MNLFGLIMAGKSERGRSRSRSRSSSSSSSRSRSRSRSPSPSISVSRSPPRSRSRSMSPVESKSLADEFRIVYQTTKVGGNGCKWFMLTIPTHQLQFLERFKPGCYNTHHHRCHDPTRFLTINPDKYLSYLGDNDLTAFCDFTVLGSHAYALFGLDITSKLNWLSYSLYNHDDVSPRRLTPPLCLTRYFCTSLSLLGKIYLLGGFAYHYCLPTESFAEVYDPVTDQWSDLPLPDNADVLIRRKKLFIASLGDLDGRILVYDYDTPDPMFYYYDVVSETWTCRVTPPPSLVLEPEFIIHKVHKAVLNKDDGCLYWIDERECFLYCFDNKSMQVFSGPIVGMEDERIFIYMESISGIRLIHLWGDFFCLLWCTEYLVPPYNEPKFVFTTEYHFTFIRAVKHPFEGFFRAFVMGCFMDSYCGHPFICDASLA